MPGLMVDTDEECITRHGGVDRILIAENVNAEIASVDIAPVLLRYLATEIF
jgi:hypothetical protein